MTTTATPATEDALASMFDAAAVRVPPWAAVVAGLASVRPDGVGATIDWLVAHRAELERAYADGQAAPLKLAEVPPQMQYQPELGYMDFERRDHALRDRHLFADIVGHRTFFQTAVYAMTGLELTPRHAAMLEQLGNVNLQADRHAWPMAVTRRIAARGGGYAAAVTGGTAMLGATVLAGAAAADCARFLRRARAAEAEGRTVAELVDDIVARRQRVMGFGRPIVGPDERVPVMEQVLRQYGRDQLPYVTLLRAADEAFFAAKGLRSTSAAWAAAVLSDFGLHPEAVQAVSNFWVSVTVYAQAVYGGERGLTDAGA
ncbi:MAG: hypothetical protein IPL61_06255 [Myxococcales bacterium]|nr:hypothetical protein [Myxococcales bacterium]